MAQCLHELSFKGPDYLASSTIEVVNSKITEVGEVICCSGDTLLWSAAKNSFARCSRSNRKREKEWPRAICINGMHVKVGERFGKIKEISPARLAAFNILQQVETGAFSSILLAAEEPRLQPADRALCHELVLGVLRWQLHLDKIVEHFAKRRIESLDPACSHRAATRSLPASFLNSHTCLGGGE